jgi:hypothetical protein
MNYETLIKNWHRKAVRQRDIFSKFVFEYLAFIAILKTQLFRGTDDRPSIQYLKREDAIKDIYLNKVNSIKQLSDDWRVIIDELNRVGLGNTSRNPFEAQEIDWWNCSHDHINQKTVAEINRPTGLLYGFDDWENMVEFWYSLRNNLFHGTKDPEIERNRLLIEYGCKTLRTLVKLLIDEHFPE